MRFRSQSWQWVYMCYKEHIVHAKPPKITQQFHQKIKYPYSRNRYTDISKNTQSKRYIARNVKYIEKETKPIPFLEDWWIDEGEYGEYVCEHGDFERGKGRQKDE